MTTTLMNLEDRHSPVLVQPIQSVGSRVVGPRLAWLLVTRRERTQTSIEAKCMLKVHLIGATLAVNGLLHRPK